MLQEVLLENGSFLVIEFAKCRLHLPAVFVSYSVFISAFSCSTEVK